MTIAIVVAMQQDLKQIMKQLEKNKKFLYQEMQQKVFFLGCYRQGRLRPCNIKQGSETLKKRKIS